MDQFIEDYIINSNTSNLIIDSICNQIQKGTYGLDKLFVSLEPYLTSKDNQKRQKAVRFTSELIKTLPSNYFNKQEVNHLGKFLCSKLEDHYTIAPAAIPGLKVLIRNENLDDESLLMIIRSILKDIHVQSLVQSDRHEIYLICYYMLVNKVDIIKSFKYDTDFVYGFIQAMDSEKDPRNLVLCFEIIQLICKNLTLGPFSDELFEVFSCYFPIDFTPPEDDEFGITKEKLVNSIRKCFAATSQFGRQTIDLLLEKLDSDVESAKLDALLTYVECSAVFNVQDYKSSIEPLWTHFQKLTMTTTSSAVEAASLRSIEMLTLSISRTVQNNESLLSLDTFIEKCVKSCLLYLTNVDLKLIWPNAKCLQAIAGASSTSNLIVFKEIVKFLLEQIKYSNENEKEGNRGKTYADILWQFINIDLKFNKNSPSKYLLEVKEDLFEICQNAVQTSSKISINVNQALQGLHLLFSYDKMTFKLSDDEIFEFLFAKISSSNFESSDKDLIVKIIFQIVSKQENSKLVDKLINHINEDFIAFISILKKFIELNTTKQFNRLIFELLVNHLVNNSTTFDEIFLHNCFECIYSIIQNGINENDEKILVNLVDFLLKFKHITKNITQKVSDIFQIFSFQLKSKQLFNLCMEKLYFAAKIFNIGNEKIDLYDVYVLNLMMQFMGSLDNKVFQEELKDFFVKHNQVLFDLSCYNNFNYSTDINEIASKFYASLVNKVFDDKLIIEFINDDFKKKILMNIEENNSKTHSSLQFLIFLAKALVMREHRFGDDFLNYLIDWLDNEKLTSDCSNAFYIILNDKADFLNPSKSHAYSKLFYRQKFFNFVYQKLKAKFETNDDETSKHKISYVIAVCSTLIFLPKKIIQQNLASMLPMLIYSLKHCNNENTWVISLRSLQDLIDQPDNHKYIYDSMSDILEVLYKLSKYKSNLDIRLISINCLFKLSQLKPQNIIKYQKEVTRNLLECLDDPKRIIRQKAVAARNKWYLLTTKED